MNRQKGYITLLLYGLLALGIIWGIWGAIAWHAKINYDRGYNQAVLDGEADSKRKRAASEIIVRDEEAKRKAAELVAADFEQKWKDAKNEAKRNKTLLIACSTPKNSGASSSSAKESSNGSSGGPYFTWQFVSLYDSAWGNQAGQSLFDHSATLKAEGASSPSPYSADELLDTHKENAKRFDQCRVDLNALITTIERLRIQWDKD